MLHQRLLQGCFLEIDIPNAVHTTSYTILDTHGDGDFKGFVVIVCSRATVNMTWVLFHG